MRDLVALLLIAFRINKLASNVTITCSKAFRTARLLNFIPK